MNLSFKYFLCNRLLLFDTLYKLRFLYNFNLLIDDMYELKIEFFSSIAPDGLVFILFFIIFCFYS